MIINCNPLHYC